MVIPLLEAKRSAVLSRLARLQQEDGQMGVEGKKTEKEEEENPSQEAVEDSKALTLEEKAERALLEGRLCGGWLVGEEIVVLCASVSLVTW